MLAGEVNKEKPAKLVPRHLWANDPEVAKIRCALIIYSIRTSIVFWITILLIALIYLGSGVVRIRYT